MAQAVPAVASATATSAPATSASAVATKTSVLGAGLSIFARAFMDSVNEAMESALAYVKVRAMAPVIHWATADFLRYPLLRENVKVEQGITPDALINFFIKSLEATAITGIAIDKDVAEELYMELIQESFSQAIHASIGGTMAVIYSYYRGSTPIQVAEIEESIGAIESLDFPLLVWLYATSGEHVYTIMYRIAKGLDRYFSEQMDRVQAQILEFTVERIRMAGFHTYAGLEILRELYTRSRSVPLSLHDRIVAINDSIAERLLARVAELTSEVETVKVLYDKELVDSSTLYATIIESIEMLRASIESFRFTSSKFIEKAKTALFYWKPSKVKEFTDQFIRDAWFKTFLFEPGLKYNHVDYDKLIKVVDAIHSIRAGYGAEPKLVRERVVIPQAPPEVAVAGALSDSARVGVSDRAMVYRPVHGALAHESEVSVSDTASASVVTLRQARASDSVSVSASETFERLKF